MLNLGETTSVWLAKTPVRLKLSLGGAHVMSEAMKQIVSTFVELRNVQALEDLRKHRKRTLEGLRALRDFDVSKPIKQNEDELAIIEEAIARLDQETGA